MPIVNIRHVTAAPLGVIQDHRDQEPRDAAGLRHLSRRGPAKIVSRPRRASEVSLILEDHLAEAVNRDVVIVPRRRNEPAAGLWEFPYLLERERRERDAVLLTVLCLFLR